MKIVLYPNDIMIVNQDAARLDAIAECLRQRDPELRFAVKSPVSKKAGEASPFISSMHEMLETRTLPSVLMVDHRQRSCPARSILRQYTQVMPPQAPGPAVILYSCSGIKELDAEATLIREELPQFPLVDVHQMYDDAKLLFPLIRRVSAMAIQCATPCSVA